MTVIHDEQLDQAQKPQHVQCCIAGCGPAGAMLGFLLARQGIEVLVLEKHADFLRDFRGDTIHPSTLQIMEELELVDQLLQIPHSKASSFQVHTSKGPLFSIDFGRLKTRWPYVVYLPQWDFLSFLTQQARRFPGFHLLMEAEAQEIIEEAGQVRGIRYHTSDGWHSVYAPLSVAADGRSSQLREQAKLMPVEMAPPMDVLWFRLSRDRADPTGTFFSLSGGHIIGLINRDRYWQIAYAIPKGSRQQVYGGGLEQLKQSLQNVAPRLAMRFDELQTWEQVKLLAVQVNRLQRWYRPGLLCIGDAAHAMSPIGGVGINLAIQDAVVAANELIEPLKSGNLRVHHLAAIQRQRMWPTRLTQMLQSTIQQRVTRPALQSEQAPRLPLPVRMSSQLPGLRDLPAHLICLGAKPVHVKNCT